MTPFLIAIALLLPLSTAAQTLGTNTSGGTDKTYTLSVKSRLVVETVVVTDKQGKTISGLTAKDFTVTEDGTPQTIRVFEHETLPTDAAPLPVTPLEDEQVKIYKRLSRGTIAAEGDDKTHYKDHRLLALYFDMSAMRPEDQQRALAAAEKFIRTQMTPADFISILRYSGGAVDVLQDFTADRNRLLSILETLVIGEGQGHTESVEDSSSVDTGAAFGQDSSEFNIFNTDRQLSALQTAARLLGNTSEKKALLYFASGLRLNGNDNQAQLHATVEAAVRAGVSFWPIDARGLVAEAPLGDATQGSAGNANLYNGTAAQATNDRFQQSQDTLFALAGDTGGKALFDNNDLTRGIVNAQHAITDYYLLGYYTTNTAKNGQFRKVSITLDDANAKLDYRTGYYAEKEFGKFNATDKERQLEDALALGDPITDLTIALELNYFQLNRAEYYVPLTVKIPGRELTLAKRLGAEHTLLDFVCEIKDDASGQTVSNVRDNVNIKLSDSTAADLLRRPVEYDAGFTLLPGRYTVKFLARDDETGRIGTYQTTLVIPNLNKELKRIPISSVVLSAQRVDLKDALYNASKAKDQARNDAVDPLVSDGRKLIPSVTRVFSRDRDLYIYLQAYATNTLLPPVSPRELTLVAYVTLYHEQKLAYQSPAIAVIPNATSRLGATPLSFTLELGTLAAGEYQAQVNVLDAMGRRVTFWRGAFLLAN